MYCLRQKSQHLRLLFIEQYMNSNRVLSKRVKKKKKKKKSKTQMWEENMDPTYTYSSKHNEPSVITIHLTHWKFIFKPTLYQIHCFGLFEPLTLHLGFKNKLCPYKIIYIIFILY